MPLRKVQLDLMAGVTKLEGPYARAEVSYRPWENVGVFSYAQWTPQNPATTGAGLGLRLQLP